MSVLSVVITNNSLFVPWRRSLLVRRAVGGGGGGGVEGHYGLWFSLRRRLCFWRWGEEKGVRWGELYCICCIDWVTRCMSPLETTPELYITTEYRTVVRFSGALAAGGSIGVTRYSVEYGVYYGSINLFPIFF